MGDEGATYIAEALKINQSLKELNLIVSIFESHSGTIKGIRFKLKNRAIELGQWEQWQSQKHCNPTPA